ncbi:hypothetical protein [Actinoplanes sp. DH11]|uniref:hypothetical protein n=1 Tax=Actinoplanes sp. DH11 TaxID=2857011 RepID=UPI001E4167BC|nr:hypothetical protein [Actinoplanes sp. DH11]
MVAADVLLGGTGNDTVDYNGRGLTVADLSGSRGNDGQPGEGDTVGSDVENLTGGDGRNVFTGNAGANRLTGGEGDDLFRGGAGNDTLYGGYGKNELYGEAGDDSLHTRAAGDPDQTSDPDKVDGGPNTDTCVVSAIDAVTNCERRG